MRYFSLIGALLTSLVALTGCQLSAPAETELSATELRLLNHWDNLDGTIERGYAGKSIFWNRGFIDTLTLQSYGQELKHIGINGTVLNNVNASPKILTDAYLDTVQAYADLLRPYGVKVWLSVNFATPMALGETATADPNAEEVQLWWQQKSKSIYERIPDFGGYLVKANSEGQPGPCDFGRSHAEGANMLAAAIRSASADGQVVWRAFVYSATDADRAKQAYEEFASLDGQFLDNVIIQIKNGPIDFQPREPVHPLFFAMPNTRLMTELQITQEYLGHSNHIVFLAPMWTEVIAQLQGLDNMVGYAGVANIGLNATTQTWHCGNSFAESNLYAFGRLACMPTLQADKVASDWITEHFTSLDPATKDSLLHFMCMSYEACVDYMMPMGLHHIFAWGHHYGPEPWCAIPGARPDWMPSYYHKADELGLGFDRTMATGSGATGQYPAQMAAMFDNPETCPEKYLLWFHHRPWTEIWQSLGAHYQRGIDAVRHMQRLWDQAEPELDTEVYEDVALRLSVQLKDAIWWKDAVLLYFQTFSHLPWPTDVEPAEHSLEEMMSQHLGISNYECPSPELLDRKR